MSLNPLAGSLQASLLDSSTPASQKAPLSPSGSPEKAVRQKVHSHLINESCSTFTPAQRERHITVIDHSMTAPALQAKNMEWQAVFVAMKACLSTYQNEQKKPDPKLQFSSSVMRFLRQCYKSAHTDCPKDIDEVVQKILQQIPEHDEPSFIKFYEPVQEHLKDVAQSCSQNIFLIKISALSVSYDKMIAGKEFDSAYASLLQEIATLSKLLLHEISDISHYKPLVITILFKIRNALNNEAYQLCKTDESITCIQFLHDLCFAIYANTELTDTFTFLEDKLHESQNMPHTLSVQLALTNVWKMGAEHGIAINDPASKDDFSTRLSGSLQLAYNSFCSGLPTTISIHNMITHLTAYLDSAKDYHGQYENNPGRLYDEQITYCDKTITSRCILTPSPAYGDKMAPEFLALLQAIENRHFQSTSTNPYFMLTYANLQNKSWQTQGMQTQGMQTEGMQTEKLMRLQEHYPISFRAITVSPEPFAVRLKPDQTKLTEKEKLQIYQELMQENNFRLDRKCGFYFPDKAEWSKAASFIVDRAYDAVIGQKDADAQSQLTALNELIKLGIIRYFELSSIRQIPKTTHNNQKAIFARSCAVCVDRGGKVNTSFLWALQESSKAHSPSWKRFLASVFVGRAILTKQRLPLPHRLEEMGVLTEVVAQRDVQRVFCEIAAFCNATSNGLTIQQQSVVSSSSSV